MDVLEWMHQQKVNIPVILITAAGSEEVAVEALKHGVYDYIRKDQITKDRLAMAIKSVHERFLYRKSMVEREAEERFLKEKQKDLDSLRDFHNTVSSLGQLMEKGISSLQTNLRKHEDLLARLAGQDVKSQFETSFKELRQDIEAVSSGVNSIRNLTNVVIQKLLEIQIAPKSNASE